MIKEPAADGLIKIIVLGDSGVGKSSILLQFAEKTFSSSFIATIGVDFKIKTIVIDGRKFKIQIWDTAGQERFRTVTNAYYRGAHGILLIYSCTDEKSFKNLSGWIKRIDKLCDEYVCYIIGNKSDCADRKISSAQGNELADSLNYKFLECSASSGENVDSIFQAISEDCVRMNLYEIGKDAPRLLSNRSTVIEELNHSKADKKSCCKI